MDDVQKEDSTSAMEPAEMLNILRTRARPWYELARFFPALLAKGVNAEAVHNATGEGRTATSAACRRSGWDGEDSLVIHAVCLHHRLS